MSMAHRFLMFPELRERGEWQDIYHGEVVDDLSAKH